MVLATAASGTGDRSNNCLIRSAASTSCSSADWETESVKMQKNPDVTVRSRGVMEKCSFCVQRINYAKITAEKQERRCRTARSFRPARWTLPLASHHASAISTIPKSACPSGNAKQTNYSLLGELNTRPRTTHLADIRNRIRNSRAGGQEIWRNRSNIPVRFYVGPVIDEGHSLASVSDKVGGIVIKRKITLGWALAC